MNTKYRSQYHHGQAHPGTSVLMEVSMCLKVSDPKLISFLLYLSLSFVFLYVSSSPPSLLRAINKKLCLRSLVYPSIHLAICVDRSLVEYIIMHFSSILAFSGSLGLTLALSGQATFYGGNLVGGNCLFSTYTLPAGIYGTALSDSNWDDALHCGQCISVTYPGKPAITAMVC
jgi:hypothetical protein